MLQQQSKLQIVDNSIVRSVCVIKNVKIVRFNRPGVLVIASIRKLRRQKVESWENKKHLQKSKKLKQQLNRGDMIRVLFVRSKKNLNRTYGLRSKVQTGIFLRFNSNAGILVDETNTPLGSRFKGPLPMTIRSKKFSKVISLTKIIA